MVEDMSTRIMWARNKAEYSKVDAARALSITAPSFSGWEAERSAKNATRPTIDHLAALALLFGVSLEWLVMGVGPQDMGVSLRSMDCETVEILQSISSASPCQREAIKKAIQAITQPF